MNIQIDLDADAYRTIVRLAGFHECSPAEIVRWAVAYYLDVDVELPDAGAAAANGGPRRDAAPAARVAEAKIEALVPRAPESPPREPIARPGLRSRGPETPAGTSPVGTARPKH